MLVLERMVCDCETKKKHLRAAQLELFDNVADLFKPVDITVVDTSRVCNHQEGHPLKQHNLIRLTDLGKVVQVALQQLHVGDK